uniref:Uncharacterized protein n=1 Tax=Avena sativa TaxID=4498 RepID=A0ACD6A2V2_AVESA
MQQMLYNGDSGISLMGNVRDRAASIGINVLDGEVLMSTYQECSKTFQGNTMCGKVSDNGSKRCMVEGCTNGAHGGTTLCIFHNSKPHIRCCAVIGCTKEARRSSQGRRGCCVNHGGGKRCKYDGCEKGAKGKTDYCVPHGGERRCKFLGCGASKTCGKDLCSMHITSLLSGNNSDHEMLPAPTPACQAKTAELSKGRFSHLVIGGRSHKKQNTNDYVNTRSFSVIETREENDRGFICLNNVPKAQNKEKDISRCRKFYDSEEKKPLDMGYLCDRMQQTLHNGDSGISVMGKVCDGAASVGTDVLDDEVLMSTYQECSKTFQGNTMDGKVHDSGSKGCTVEGCTNGLHRGTALCIFHNSRPHKRCCAVTGCTKTACEGSQGRTDHCVKHGGGKRCKYDGCGKGAQGNTDSCIAHGGGRRCKFQGCRKSAQGRCDYCIRHGGGRRCKFPGCSASATCGTDFCYKHRISLSSGSNFGREMLPAPAHETKNAEPSKRRNSHSVIGGRSQKRQNANDHVNTVAETGGK